MYVPFFVFFFFFQAEDGIRDLVRSRGLGDVYKRQSLYWTDDKGGVGSDCGFWSSGVGKTCRAGGSGLAGISDSGGLCWIKVDNESESDCAGSSCRDRRRGEGDSGRAAE